MKKSGRFHWWGPLVCCALCLAGAAGPGGIQASVRSRSPAVSFGVLREPAGSTAELASHLEALYKQWKALPTAGMASEVPAIKRGIDAAITAYVAARLSATARPFAQGLQYELAEALAVPLTGRSLQDITRTYPSFSMYVSVVEGVGYASPLYVVAFPIGYGNVFSTRVHAFAPQAGKYRSVGPVSKLDGAVSGALRLRSFAPHELRVMVWCLHIGSPEALTSVALYKFDGKALQTVWLRQDVPGAKVALRGRLVVIESHWPVLHRSGATFHYEQKFYRQVPAGLKLVKTERWVES